MSHARARVPNGWREKKKSLRDAAAADATATIRLGFHRRPRVAWPLRDTVPPTSPLFHASVAFFRGFAGDVKAKRSVCDLTPIVSIRAHETHRCLCVPKSLYRYIIDNTQIMSALTIPRTTQCSAGKLGTAICTRNYQRDEVVIYRVSHLPLK